MGGFHPIDVGSHGNFAINMNSNIFFFFVKKNLKYKSKSEHDRSNYHTFFEGRHSGECFGKWRNT